MTHATQPAASSFQNCESRVEASMKGRLDDIRQMWHGVEAKDVQLADNGTLDTILTVGDVEISYSDSADYRDEKTGALDVEAFAAEHLDDINEELRERFYDYGLCFDYVEAGTFTDQEEAFFRFQLSTGGPGDEFRFYANPGDLSVHRIEYWFLDWFDGAHRVLAGDDKALMKEIWDDWRETGTVRAAMDKASS